MFFCLCRYSTKLGEQLANLHLHNKRQMEKQKKEMQTVGNVFKYDHFSCVIGLSFFKCVFCVFKGKGLEQSEVVNKFGFHVATCCGYIPQVSICGKIKSIDEIIVRECWMRYFCIKRFFHLSSGK